MLAIEVPDDFGFDRCRHETFTMLVFHSLSKRVRNTHCSTVDVVGDKDIVALTAMCVSIVERR